MKYLFTLLLLTFGFVGLVSAQSALDEKPRTITLTPAGTPVITFDSTKHNFGTVKEGEALSHVFNFVNEGDGPLIISAVKPSCSCTVSSYSRDTIMPGQTGSVTLEFDTKHRVGRFVKTATVTYNSEMSPQVLLIEGMVEAVPGTEVEMHEEHSH